ncbi:MAG: hypothetical protein QM728_00535 [Gordonia sp. (in: high G+C Gram-positive bacteria)]|uniref:hypothetical protein n=1 Tax=Gordonia sp. (in: high G+C Gram-positive bacteria) TaxID=84139 RepID=UPI0039E636F1
MKKLTVGIAVLACLGLSACSQIEDVVDKNKGSQTTCGKYVQLTGPEQTDVVMKFLEDDKGFDQPGELLVTANKTAILAYCNTTAGTDDPISNTPIVRGFGR